MEGITALRLLSHKIPIIEIALNYNVLWFYPITWLFKIVGPSYTALRIFFFSISTLTGLLAFYIVKKTSCNPLLGFFAGILALVLPGQLFRNYMAFVVMLNMFLFLKTFLLPSRTSRTNLLSMAATGCSLGLTFLIRIDLGFFLSLVFLGLVLLYPWIKSQHINSLLKKPFLMALAGLVLGVIGFLLFHIPAYCDAEKKGFVAPFVTQYIQWPHMIVSQAGNLLKNMLHPQAGPTSWATYSSQPLLATSSSDHRPAKSNLLRPAFHTIDMRTSMMMLNIYLPIICGLLLLLVALLFFLVGKKNKELSSQAWMILTMLGCALTLLPQYFFWRPDMVHLSEFMVPMTATLLVAISFVWNARKKMNLFFQPFLWLFLSVSTLTLTLYWINGCQSQSTGGIAISQGRTKEFSGMNGVHVRLTPHELEETTAIYQTILQHSRPEDYVICYPYNPEINFMTNRPSYRRDLYCDDMTALSNFDQTNIEEIKKFQPAVIVVTDWPINGTEHSRFSKWASTTYEYIQHHYSADYEHGIIHVFVRPKIHASKDIK